MKVVVTTEARFYRSTAGIICPTGGRAYGFWKRYLEGFDRVQVVARVADPPAETPSFQGQPVEGPGVSVYPLADYAGASGLLRTQQQIRNRFAPICRSGHAYILRTPSAIADLFVSQLRRLNLPYALEVVGDPYELFSPQSLQHPLRPLLRTYSLWQLRRQCRLATAVAYVTEHALQKRYPADSKCLQASYSSVEMPEDAYRATPRVFSASEGVRTLICVATFRQRHKGQHVLLESFRKLYADRPDLRLVFVGEGKWKTELQELTQNWQLGNVVRFAGLLSSGLPVRKELDAADVFVFPALGGDGVPRALIEAMARGLPAVATNVGGISELLPERCLVPPGDSDALAARLRQVIADRGWSTQLSQQNLQVARGYRSELLTPRRTAFYRNLQQQLHTVYSADESFCTC